MFEVILEFETCFGRDEVVQLVQFSLVDDFCYATDGVSGAVDESAFGEFRIPVVLQIFQFQFRLQPTDHVRDVEEFGQFRSVCVRVVPGEICDGETFLLEAQVFCGGDGFNLEWLQDRRDFLGDFDIVHSFLSHGNFAGDDVKLFD